MSQVTHPFARSATAGIAFAAAALLAGCAGGSDGAVAPARGTPNTGIAAIDAVQGAIGGTWGDTVTMPHGACVVDDEPKPGDGMQSVVSTTSIVERSEGAALEAANLAATALEDIGAEAGDVAQADGIATVSATDEANGSVTVTVATDQAYIEYRSECIIGDEYL
ncbi:MAG: hypothetical protein ACTH31_11035 [Pseudoclavibacter sp.]